MMKHFARITNGAVDLLVGLPGTYVVNSATDAPGPLGTLSATKVFTPDPNWPGAFVDVSELYPDMPSIGAVYNAQAGTFAAPPAPALTALQQIQANFSKYLSAGVPLQSGTNVGLNGTYAIAGRIWEDMKNEAQYINTFGAFSGGAPALVWPVAAGTVNFATTAAFMSAVRGLADFLSKYKNAAQGQGAEPAPPVQIA